jgi:hypothetical protein
MRGVNSKPVEGVASSVVVEGGSTSIADAVLPDDDFDRLSDRDLGLRVNGHIVLSEATEFAVSLDCQSELCCSPELCPSALALDDDETVGDPRSGCHETDFFDLK